MTDNEKIRTVTEKFKVQNRADNNYTEVLEVFGIYKHILRISGERLKLLAGRVDDYHIQVEKYQRMCEEYQADIKSYRKLRDAYAELLSNALAELSKHNNTQEES